MNSNWRSFLESSGAVFKDGGDEVLNFGDASGELQAARDQTVLVPLTHLGLIEATGDDAKAFLHSQFTSDINHLGADQIQHSAWCTAKGRMQASFLAWREQISEHLEGVLPNVFCRLAAITSHRSEFNNSYLKKTSNRTMH